MNYVLMILGGLFFSVGAYQEFFMKKPVMDPVKEKELEKVRLAKEAADKKAAALAQKQQEEKERQIKQLEDKVATLTALGDKPEDLKKAQEELAILKDS